MLLNVSARDGGGAWGCAGAPQQTLSRPHWLAVQCADGHGSSPHGSVKWSNQHPSVMGTHFSLIYFTFFPRKISVLH